MWVLMQIAALLGGAAAASQIANDLSRGANKRTLKRQTKRGTTTPHEALRLFRRSYPHVHAKLGRVQGGAYVLVVDGAHPAHMPHDFDGYHIIIHEDVP